MSTTDILHPDEHHDSIEIDLITQEFSRTSTDPGLAIASLRDFNSQLLAKIGLIRMRNLELTKSETALREVVSELQSKSATQERLIEQKNHELERAQALNHAAARALDKANQAHRSEMESLESAKNELSDRVDTLEAQLAESKLALEQLAQREEQALEAFERVREEYTNIDKCYQQATDRAAQLSAQLSDSKIGFDKVLVEMNARLQSDFQKQFSALMTENHRLQAHLEARDTRIETELAKLKTRQDQVGFLEQHLNQQAAAMKKDKADMLRIAKLLSHDNGRPNPFKGQTDEARTELAGLLKKLSGVPGN